METQLICCYDLGKRMPTYDFFLWLCHVKLLGATRITFDLSAPKYKLDRKWPREETMRRFKNFIEPGPLLLDLPSWIGSGGDKEIGSIWVQDIWRDCQRLGRDLPRLRSVLPPANVKYTVTLRQSFWKPERNSDEVLWRKFAAAIGAHVVEDYEKQPIDLNARLALYAGAKMNFGVPNGPLHICFLSDYPIVEFCDPAVTLEDYARHDFKIGSEYPWSDLETQRHVWQKPTMDLLMVEYEKHA